MRTLVAIITLCFIVSMIFAQDDIIFFSDSPDGDILLDASWGFYSQPSYLELKGNNDKFPVDAQHPYQGAHSLRLHWISKSGGDWGIAVASQGWQRWDFTKYDSIVYWINAPAAIEPEDLPDFGIEDVTNRRSSRINLSQFVEGVDADSTTWQKVSIPIDSIPVGPDNCDYTKIKTIFHYQANSDGEEHIVWIDEIRIIKAGGTGPTPPPIPTHLMVEGHDSRIDLKWDLIINPDLLGFYIYRSSTELGPFEKINQIAHQRNLYSDFFGENDRTYYYYITAVNNAYDESEPSDTLSATSYEMNEEELLTSIQKATFRYFWDYGHPVSGLTREVSGSGNTCTSGGTGFGLMTIMVGTDREFVSRDSAAARVLKILSFLQDSSTRYHGAWPHWINGETGETIPFSMYDDGGDIVETAYLVQGLLTIRQYFTLDNAVETEIRNRATELWETVEWDWYRRNPYGIVLYWHWSPNYDWRMNMPVIGFNECMIVYLLAIASPTHPVPSSLYYEGWAASPNYTNGNSYYGYKQWVGKPYGGPLFFTHYSFLGFDPRDKQDQFCNYFENNRNISLIHRAYCMENPKQHAGYDSLVWGLTASYNPWGYSAHEPFTNDNGTITPTAAISAMPYTPNESIATLKHFYYQFGDRLWGEFGFKDAFNLNQNWFAEIYVSIDQGTIVPMIENYRTELCWNMFMQNTEIQDMLQAVGFTGVEDYSMPTTRPKKFTLMQNYPNPFNTQTVIKFGLPEESIVTIEIFNLRAEKVETLLNKTKKPVGFYSVNFDAKNLPSGMYFYRIKTNNLSQMRKMLLLK